MINAPEPTPDPLELVRTLEEVVTGLARLHRDVERIDLELDAAVLRLRRIVSDAGRNSPAAELFEPATPSSDSLKLSKETRRAFVFLASAGTSRWSVEWNAQRGAEVRLGDSDAFFLPTKLALLLEIIGSGKKMDSAGFVPWKSLTAVAKELQQLSGGARAIQDHAVTRLIGRLRVELYRHRVNPYLVETRRGRGGVRLRRKPSEYVV